jgi:hypothetical protein
MTDAERMIYEALCRGEVPVVRGLFYNFANNPWVYSKAKIKNGLEPQRDVEALLLLQDGPTLFAIGPV